MGPKPFIDLGGEVIVNAAVKVDKSSKLITVKTGEQFGYDKLVFATGSVPVIPKFIPGHELQNVFYIKKSYPYIHNLTSKIAALRNIVVVGGGFIDADAVILAIGYLANSRLAKETGLELNRYGDIHVDNYGRTTVKDISAVGDCAQTFGFLTGRSDNIKLASTATAEARTLGHNIFGIRIKKCISGTLGVFSTEVNGLAMAGAGANESSAEEANVEFISAKFTSPDRHPGTLKGTSNLTVKLYASPLDGSILGGEAWGGKSVGEIINIISMAIQKSITVYELVSFQIGTHPLLTSSPVNNPIIRAAEEIIHKIMHNQKARSHGTEPKQLADKEF